MSMMSQETLVNAYVIIKYSDGHWGVKNYWGFPVKAFLLTIDEMVKSSFTEYVISVYFQNRRKFEKAVIEKGERKELYSILELRDWLLTHGGKVALPVLEVYLW